MPPLLKDAARNLVESGLLSAEEVRAYQSELLARNPAADAEALLAELVRLNKLTGYQANAIYQGRPEGLVFGNYTVLDKIGAGGMGMVFKAQHRRMNQIVALKVLPPSATKSPDAVKRFRREIEAAARLVRIWAKDLRKVRHFLKTETAFITGFERGRSLAWSADGQWLAEAGSSPMLRLWSADAQPGPL